MIAFNFIQLLWQCIMSLFSSQITKRDVENKIKEALALLPQAVTEGKNHFIRQLEQRISEFESELAKKNNEEQVLRQYHKFAQTLYSCLKYPKSASATLSRYLNHDYYPVGVHELHKPPQRAQNIARLAVVTGIVLFLFCLPELVIHPLIGAITLSLAISLLLPGGFGVFLPATPDVHKKQEQERIIVQDAVRLIDPHAVLDNDSEAFFRIPVLL